VRSSANRILLLAVVGAILGATLCLIDLAGTRDTLGGLVTAKEGRWEADVVLADLPDEPRDSGGSHDGGFFYVIARDPFDLDLMETSLDFPRYRVQRILYPALAWAAHPTGGGPSLVWTMFAVNVVGLVLGGFATGRLSTALGGPAWPAVIFGPMMGSIVSLRLSVSDSLVLAFAISALALSILSRHRWAIVAAVAAVLTKETSVLIFVGFALWRRDRHGVALFAVPLAIAGAWWVVLAMRFPGPLSPENYRPPLLGWRDAFEFWFSGYEPLGLLSAAAGVVIAVAALVRTSPRHPLWWPLVLLLGSCLLFSVNVLGPERNASRIFLPMQILGIVALVTRRYQPQPDRPRPLVEDPVATDPVGATGAADVRAS